MPYFLKSVSYLSRICYMVSWKETPSLRTGLEIA